MLQTRSSVSTTAKDKIRFLIIILTNCTEHNGCGTVNIINFYAGDYGKVGWTL